MVRGLDGMSQSEKPKSTPAARQLLPIPAGGSYQVGDLLVDIGRGRVTREDQVVPLPRLSFDLLIALIAVLPFENLSTSPDGSVVAGIGLSCIVPGPCHSALPMPGAELTAHSKELPINPGFFAIRDCVVLDQNAEHPMAFTPNGL
jgi:hypothetical protein